MAMKSDDRLAILKKDPIQAEAARQFALERYDVLDTAKEYCFDHITNAVKLALDVPMAAISLMDGERLWFKSKIGFTVEEVPRYTALCNHTIAQNSSLIIENLAEDPRFTDCPSVSARLSLTSYVGVPLTTPDGHNIGTLCAGDLVPRQFQPSKVELVEQLAELVMHELELRQQADTDRLTGALTRSGFSLAVQKAITFHDRKKKTSTLVLFEVDLHKMVNHCSGKMSGNAILRAIVQLLISRLDPSNCVGRLGGTQFAVLLTATNQAEALIATERFLKRLQEADAGVFLDIGFSEITPGIGICEDWLKQANVNLADAKASGQSRFYAKAGLHLHPAS